jgi:hypothetical protein
MIKKILHWIKNIFKPTRQEKVVELTDKQQKIKNKYKEQ